MTGNGPAKQACATPTKNTGEHETGDNSNFKGTLFLKLQRNPEKEGKSTLWEKRESMS